MNKRGGDKLISIYWFFILVLVAGGIVMMVNIFYSSPYDVRVTEGEILARKVSNCVMEGGKMNIMLTSPTGVFRESFKDDFMDICDLTFSIESEFERPQYYVEVNFYDINSLKNSKFQIIEGNSNWKADCNFKNHEIERTAKCVEKEFYSVDATNKLYLIKILTIVGKTAENVK